MGLRTLARRLYALSVDDPKAWDSSLWNPRAQAAAGENVNESTALTYSAVWAAVNLLAGTISALPLDLMSRKGGRREVQDWLPGHRVLHTAANEYMTAMSFREAQMAHLLLWGNAYAEVVRNGYGDVVALWPITPDRVKPFWSDAGIAYEIRVPGPAKPVILPRERVLHIPGLGFDGLVGYSVVAMAKKSIGLGLAMETFGSDYFSQGIHPSAVITHTGRLSDDGRKALREGMSETYGGLSKAHRLMLLQETSKFEKISIQPEESQFLESRQFQIPEIARWFGLQPHKLGDLTRASFSNIAEEQISFVVDSLTPKLVRLEQCYNTQLLSQNEQRRLYYKHALQGLMRGSHKDRAEYYGKLWGIGVLSANQILELEDMDPIEGGDTHFVPANMVPLERAIDPRYWTAQKAPPQLPPATEDRPDDSPDDPDGAEAQIAALLAAPGHPQNGKGHPHALTA